jgi:hypothetical protein
MLLKLGSLSVVLAALALVALWLVPRSSALKQPGIIRITDREIAYRLIDIGPDGRSPGDVEITRRLLFNRRITQRSLGHADLVCTFTFGNSRQCTGTYELPAGKIVVSGPMTFRQFFQLAVVGGTGKYDNVGGTLTVTSLGRKPRRDIVLFRLTI